jgi:hypothetical protein
VAENKIRDDEDLENKFVIPGGWIGVCMVLAPVVGISLFLVSIVGWESLVMSVAMLVGMWILKGLDVLYGYLMKRRKNTVEELHKTKKDEMERGAMDFASP